MRHLLNTQGKSPSGSYRVIGRLRILCAEFPSALHGKLSRLMRVSYVEKTLEKNDKFDAEGLVSQDPSHNGRLKYWTNELCAQHPHTFDFVVTVGFLTLCSFYDLLLLT